MPDTEPGNEPTNSKPSSTTAEQEPGQGKKRIGTFLGYEVSVAEGTKSPVLRLVLLLSANILLLIIFKVLISR